MEIRIIEVVNRYQLKQFIYLPEKIHQHHKNWVPPIYHDEWVFFNPQKNPLFDHCEYILLLALNGNEPVGRIMGLINHKYNQSHNERDARFAFMETYNNPTVAMLLMDKIEEWAIKHAMKNLVGPLCFSDKDPQGMMIDGFDHPLAIATNCNFPYQAEFLVPLGFTKKVDLVSYKIDIPDKIPPIYAEIYQRRLTSNNIRVLDFKSVFAVRPFVVPVLTLLNEVFKDIYAFVPFEKREMAAFANRYLPMLDARFIKVIVSQQNTPVAFIIAMPDITPGIIKSKGHLFPFGIFKILQSKKHAQQLTLLLGGIHPDYRGTGLDVVLGVKLLHEAHAKGLKYIDSHLVLETNTKMRAELERLGGYIYKRYRIFTKPLSNIS
jgi:GNAT superfamily N-acetyltransferase